MSEHSLYTKLIGLLDERGAAYRVIEHEEQGATQEAAERLAGSVSGTILPFSFDPELQLVVDPALLVHDEIFFNAARLDRSLALRTADYEAIAEPRTATIAQEAAA
ncbi:YbaK/EbsC family protein [Streptomyces sp. NPDC048436]|uniref:YbaK/EbsC family protein n=1 Tax=Streptomyces sp. NPDC048436 TaxID=3365550 RepID=UPI0037223819